MTQVAAHNPAGRPERPRTISSSSSHPHTRAMKPPHQPPAHDMLSPNLFGSIQTGNAAVQKDHSMSLPSSQRPSSPRDNPSNPGLISASPAGLTGLDPSMTSQAADAEVWHLGDVGSLGPAASMGSCPSGTECRRIGDVGDVEPAYSMVFESDASSITSALGLQEVRSYPPCAWANLCPCNATIAPLTCGS